MKGENLGMDEDRNPEQNPGKKPEPVSEIRPEPVPERSPGSLRKALYFFLICGIVIGIVVYSPLFVLRQLHIEGSQYIME